MNGVKEKYEICVFSEAGMNLMDGAGVAEFIQERIEDKVSQCVVDFITHHKVEPTTIRMSGGVFSHYKNRMKKVTDNRWLEDKEVFFREIPVEALCKFDGNKVVCEYWESE